MNDVSRKMVSHGGMYLFGSILQRAVSFIMLPIYTRYLTPADYGILELLSLVIDIVGILLGLRVSQAIFRFYHEYEETEQRYTVITTAMILIGAFTIFGVLAIVALGKPLSLLVFDHADAVHLLVTFSFTLLFQAFIEVPMLFLRARQKPVLFVIFSTLRLLLQLGLNIYLVVFLHMRVEGVIYSAVITGLVMSGILVAYTLRITGMHFSASIAKALISFSLPLALTGLISFFITFGDRYFLRYYGGLEDVGIYSLAYKFGFLLMFLVVQPFSNHWDSEKYIIMRKPNAKQIYQQTFLAYSSLVIVFVALVSVFVKDILRIMSDSAFWPAHVLAPVVMLAYTFNAWASYTNLGIFARNKTMEITYGTLIGAVVSAVAYATLIPRFGAWGAAWATVFGFASRFLWINWRSQKLYDMSLPWRKVWVTSFLGFAAYILSTLGPEEIIPSLLCNLMISVALLACMFLLPIFPDNWRRSILATAHRPWRLRSMLKDAGNTNLR